MKDNNAPVILDNRHAKLADYLRARLGDAKAFRIVSAYFSVFGFETLADGLESASLKKVKFLFGSPESAGEIISGETARQTFDLTESGLSPQSDGVLGQRLLAKKCVKWLDKGGVEVKKISRSNFLHGKMYHLESANGGAATVGSSNFTRRGMGESKNPNIEINLAATDEKTHAALAEWFDELWDSGLATDAKKEMLAALKHWCKEYPPDFLYYKTLYELFREEIEQRLAEEQTGYSGLHDSQVWNALYEFQKDGAKSVINRLQRLGGCILADSVGLGKTYTALAAIKYFELRGERVLVLSPKKLEQNWRVYQHAADDTHNPFGEDKFLYTLLMHTDLNRERGMSGIINLESFDWGKFGLVVIDESHNFRNESKSRRDDDGDIVRHSRYEKLLDAVVKEGAKTKVLMLSATPVNTSLTDLQNQIYLMTAKRDDAFAKTLGIRNIKTVVREAQKKFHEWENTPGNRDKNKLLENLGGDFLNLLGGVTIARSRRQITEFYRDFIAREGDFPKRELPQNKHPHTDSRGELSYEKLYADIEKMQFYIYRPSAYITDDAVRARLDADKKKFNFNQVDRERFLIAMMRINFLKRLESSAHACALTLQRTLNKIDAQIANIDKFLQTREDSTTEIPGAADDNTGNEETYTVDGDDDFIVNRKAMKSYHLHELNVQKWHTDMQTDRVALQSALEKVAAITPARDGKLALLKQQIRDKAKQSNRKLLLFTAFKDTAKYLHDELRQLADECDINIALVAGDTTISKDAPRTFGDILDRFSPQARKRKIAADKCIDLLIATDCISEGQNLQDCDTVLNYDIHWNPVRLIQRFGRIDRIGSPNTSVRMINYWPTENMETYLQLKSRVCARMALADAAATGDDDALNETESSLTDVAQGEFNFRDQQLRQIQKEVIDLDADDSVGLSDFTLDYFITQLLRHLEQKREKLKEAPRGIYAVANSKRGGRKEGVIFFFRQPDAGTNTVRNPKHPFYFVHLEGGKVCHGYMHLRAILQIFENLARGETDTLMSLCHSFAAEMETPEGKKFYDSLAAKAIADINAVFHDNSGSGLQGRGGILPKESELPSAANLELLTWLVIKTPQPVVADAAKPAKPANPILTPPREKNPPPPMFNPRKKTQ